MANHDNLDANFIQDQQNKAAAQDDVLTNKTPLFDRDTTEQTEHQAAPKTNTLELLAEKPQVEVERVNVGQVRLSKQVKTQTVQVPVTLTQEILVIEHHGQVAPLSEDGLVNIASTQHAAPQIMINGQTVELGDAPVEIVLSQQVAHVQVQTQVVEEVSLRTDQRSHTEQVDVTLRHEELVVEELKHDNPTVISTSVVSEDAPRTTEPSHSFYTGKQDR